MSDAHAPQILHFTLGPVQGFISNARRTRDYWAGSFLLAYLSGVAMKAILDGKYGTIDFPDVATDPLFQAFGDGASTVHIGSLPNRFRATIADPDRFRHDSPCEKAVQKQWARIAEIVWGTFLGQAAPLGDGTSKIWDEQIGKFWDMAWVMGPAPTGDEPEDGLWLDRRKNWRTHWPPAARGDHCMIMSDYQELSGHSRATADGREKQEAFWESVQDQVSEIINPGRRDRDYGLLEVQRSERLCAIALVKRLFPILPQSKLRDAIGWVPDTTAEASRTPEKPGRIRFWPSTAYVAASPWLRHAHNRAPGACRGFAVAAKSALVQAVAERRSRLRGLEDTGDFGRLDGTFFFEDALRTDIANAEAVLRGAERQEPRTQSPRLEWARREQRRKRAILRGLEGLQHAVANEQGTHRQRKFKEASPFYALLLMDGDKSGELMGQKRIGAEAVSDAFARFTGQVKEIVPRHDGVLIYAGGDDVKAFLPLDKAVGCCLDVHRAYLEAFTDALKGKPDETATISAGVVFAHFHVPLTNVVREGHRQLDEVAKDKNGRNSLAIALLRPSGRAAEYVSTFARQRTEDDPGAEGPLDCIMRLAELYAAEPERSTSFLYNLRTRYGDVFGTKGVFDNDEELEDALFSEWMKGARVSGQAKADEERRKVRQLLDVCMARQRDSERRFNLDGGMLARFLADNGVGAGTEPPA